MTTSAISCCHSFAKGTFDLWLSLGTQAWSIVYFPWKTQLWLLNETKWGHNTIVCGNASQCCVVLCLENLHSHEIKNFLVWLFPLQFNSVNPKLHSRVHRRLLLFVFKQCQPQAISLQLRTVNSTAGWSFLAWEAVILRAYSPLCSVGMHARTQRRMSTLLAPHRFLCWRNRWKDPFFWFWMRHEILFSNKLLCGNLLLLLWYFILFSLWLKLSSDRLPECTHSVRWRHFVKIKAKEQHIAISSGCGGCCCVWRCKHSNAVFRLTLCMCWCIQRSAKVCMCMCMCMCECFPQVQ